jgi:hypothetical protein
MLVLRRSNSQWIEITHKSGDMIRFCVYGEEMKGSVNLAFDDAARNFEIRRPEREARTATARPDASIADAPPLPPSAP